MSRFAAVIVAYESSDDLASCIESLEAAGTDQILVVDNASPGNDGEIARLAGAELLSLEHNLGFAGGANAGIAATDGELVAIVNPDIRAHDDTVEACRSVFDDEPDLAALAPLLLRGDGLTADSAGQGLKPGRLEVLDHGYDRPLAELDLEPRPVLAACGAFAVFRRSCLKRAQDRGEVFAEHYFCFWEDLELGWRMNNLGLEVGHRPQVVATHGRGGGAQAGRGPMRWRRPVELEACILTNRWMTLARHLHPLDLLPRLPLLLAWDLSLSALSLARRPSLAPKLSRRLPLVAAELRRRHPWPKRRLSELPC